MTLRQTLARLAVLAIAGTLTLSLGTSASAALGAPASASAPAENVQWTVSPATADGPDDRISLRHVIDPGGSVSDAIAVTNSGTVAATFDVHAGDGVIGANGAFDIASGAPTDSGRWVTLEGLTDGTISLAPGEVRVLPVTISVPADATPGDHPAGIVVGIAQNDDGMVVHHRIGIRAHIQVAGELAPAIDVTEVATTYTPNLNPFVPGVLEITYTVTNTGNVRIGASDAVSLAGIFGLAPAESAAGEPTELLPGGAISRVQRIDMPPLFVLSGDVTVTPVGIGDDELTLPSAVSAGFSIVAVPWGALIGLVLLAGVVLLVVWLVRRGRHRAQQRIDDAVAAARARDAEQADRQEETVGVS